MVQEYESEIYKLLKLGGDHVILPSVNGAPEGLPVLANQEPEPAIPVETIDEYPVVMPKDFVLEQPRNKFKGLIVYPFVFLIAFVFFYVVLNFGAVAAQVQGVFTKPQDEQILGSQMQAYYNWIQGYFYAVNDRQMLDPNNDINKNGLTNYEKFILHLNPLVDDTAGIGVSDGIKVLNNMNLWGQGSMTEEQKKLLAQLNLIDISTRISFYTSQTHGKVAGASTNNFDLTKPGLLSIPKLNVTAPLIFPNDPSEFDTDLTQGVIHYPGTALPGEQGVVYVSGHSSDYFWKNHPYKQIFAKLNYLKPGDDIFVEMYGLDGKTFQFRYQVVATNTYKPDDQLQFIDDSTKKLNLSTCWPIGTQKDRLVVSAVLQ